MCRESLQSQRNSFLLSRRYAGGLGREAFEQKGAAVLQVFKPHSGIEDDFGAEVENLMQAAQAAERGASVVRFVEGFSLEQGQEWCIIMSPLAAGSMEDAISSRSYSLAEALRWLVDVAQGLHMLHTASFRFHGDLRPANVLIGEDGRAVIGDLGIAMHNHRFGMDRQDLLKASSVSLPPEINLPEQGTQEPLFTASADVWSCGVLADALLRRTLDRFADVASGHRELLRLTHGQDKAAWLAELAAAWPTEQGTVPGAVLEAVLLALRDVDHRATLSTILGLLAAAAEPRLSAAPATAAEVPSDQRQAMRDLAAVERVLGRGDAGEEGKEEGEEAAAERGFLLLRKGLAHIQLDQLAMAEAALRRCLPPLRRGFEPDSTSIYVAVIHLGEVLAKKGRWLEAEPLCVEARTLLTSAVVDPAARLRSTQLLATIYHKSGRSDRATVMMEEALEAMEGLGIGSSPEACSVLVTLGLCDVEAGRKDRGAARLRRAARIERRGGGDNVQLCVALNNLGLAYDEDGDSARAGQMFEEALALARAAVAGNMTGGRDGSGGDLQYLMASILNNLASGYYGHGQYQLAVETHGEALRLKRLVLPEGHPSLGVSLDNLGNALRQAGKLQEAVQCYYEALAIFTTAFGDGPHQDKATCLVNIADTKERAGELHDALDLQEQALEMRMAVLPSNHSHVRLSVQRVAQLRMRLPKPSNPNLRVAQAAVLNCNDGRGGCSDDAKAAAQLLEHLFRTHETIKQQQVPDQRVFELVSLGMRLHKQKQHTAAVEVLTECLQLCRATLPADHPYIGSSLNNLACVYSEMGRLEHARDLYEEALIVTTRGMPANHPNVIATRKAASVANFVVGNFARAAALMEEADRTSAPSYTASGGGGPVPGGRGTDSGDGSSATATVVQQMLGVSSQVMDDPSTWSGLHSPELSRLGGMYESRGRFDLAARAFGLAAQRLREAGGPTAAGFVATLYSLAGVYQTMRDPVGALAVLREAREALDAAPDASLLARVLDMTSVTTTMLGKTDEALDAAEQACAVELQALGPAPSAERMYRLRSLATLLEADRPSRALLVFTDALQAARAVLRPEDRELARCLSDVSRVLVGLGRHEEALPMQAEAVVIARTAYAAGPDRALSRYLHQLSEIVAAVDGDGEDAAKLFSEAEDVERRARLRGDSAN